MACLDLLFFCLAVTCHAATCTSHLHATMPLLLPAFCLMNSGTGIILWTGRCGLGVGGIHAAGVGVGAVEVWRTGTVKIADGRAGCPTSILASSPPALTHAAAAAKQRLSCMLSGYAAHEGCATTGTPRRLLMSLYHPAEDEWRDRRTTAFTGHGAVAPYYASITSRL